MILLNAPALAIFVAIILLRVGRTPAITGVDDDLPWWNIHSFLRNVANGGLQAEQLQGHLYKNYTWPTIEINPNDLLKEKTSKLESIFRANIAAVSKLRRAVEDHYELFGDESEVTDAMMCCRAFNESGTRSGCVITSKHGGLRAGIPPNQVLEVLRSNRNRQVWIQYFAFNDSSLYVYPGRNESTIENCDTYDATRRYWYVLSQSPCARDVLIVVDYLKDRGSKDLIIETFNLILDTVTPNDRVAVVFGEKDLESNQKVAEKQVLPGVFVWGHDRNKKKILSLLEEELSDSGVNSGFKSHASIVGSSQLTHPPKLNLSRDAAFVFVELSNRPGWSEWTRGTELVQEITTSLENCITLIIYPIGEEAAKNISVGLALRDPSCSALYFAPIESFQDLSKHYASLSSYFSTTDEKNCPAEESGPVIPVSYWDAFGDGLIMSVCVPMYFKGSFLGAACTDISIVNVLEFITNLPEVDGAYGFLTDGEGRALLHPLLPSPHSVTEDPTYVLAEHLEQSPAVASVLRDMIALKPGQKVVDGMLIQSPGGPHNADIPTAVHKHPMRLLYIWMPINNTDISLAVVLPITSGKVLSVRYKCNRTAELVQDPCEVKHFLYHKRKLYNSTPRLCRFFGVDVDPKQGLVKLAPSCFRDVLQYVRGSLTSVEAQLQSFFNGEHKQEVQDSLRGFFRESVALVETAESLWLKSLLSEYIGFRYLGTADGVFIAFPGTELKSNYDHRTRPWYMAASFHKKPYQTVALTTPYCDEWGAGIIMTVASPLLGPPPHYPVVGVVAGDFTIQYMLNHFLSLLPPCESTYKCFLMDESGYIVLHTEWMDPYQEPCNCASAKDLEAAHISVIEPDITHDLIQRNVLRRKACHDYVNDVVYFYWIVMLTGCSTRLSASRYEITYIPFTNLYLVTHLYSQKHHHLCHCSHSQDRRKQDSLECQDTCTNHCECPCLAGPNTTPCLDAAKDLIKEKLPACLPRGIRIVSASNSIKKGQRPEEFCHKDDCSAKSKKDCNSIIWCTWLSNGTCSRIDKC